MSFSTASLTITGVNAAGKHEVMRASLARAFQVVSPGANGSLRP